jgi:hypothetical protein
VTYSLVPYGILIISNILLLNHVYRSSKRVATRNIPTTSTNIVTKTKTLCTIKKDSRMSRPKKKFNKAIVVSTIIYILMTLPSAIASFYFNQWWGTPVGDLLINICDDLSLTYHGYLYFVIYIVINRRFRGQLKLMFNWNKTKINGTIMENSLNTQHISHQLNNARKIENKEKIVGTG